MIRSNKRQKEQARLQKRLAKEQKQEEKKKQRASGIIAGATDEHGMLLHPELHPTTEEETTGQHPSGPEARPEENPDSAKAAGVA